MTETFVLGGIHGLTIGLLAIGLVLVYKANRFINLGHAQLGALSAVLLAKFGIDWGLSWWVGFPVAIAVGVITGLVVERWVIRPVSARSKATASLLLASVGVSQLLLALVFVEPFRPNDSELTVRGYPQPFDVRVRIGGVTLGTAELLIVVLVPLMVAGLAVFLRYTLTGKMIRAAASNEEAARLCGISVAHVSRVAWGLAGGLSALTAVLLAPSQASFDAAQLGPELLLRALGAAAVGGFASVPAACAGGLVLGLVEQYTQYVTGSGASALLAVFVAILGIFVVRARAISAAAVGRVETADDRRPVRVPPSLASWWVVRSQRVLLALSGMGIALLAPLLPYFSTEARRFQLTLVLIYGLVGVALTVVVGWAGQVSLGHFALVGAGAFVAGRLSAHEWSMVSLLVVAGLVGALIMAMTGLPALRLQGLTVAVTSLGLAVVAPAWLFRQHWFGSDTPYGVLVQPIAIASGLGRPYEQGEVYYTAVVVMGLALSACALLRNSGPGRLIVAVRDNDQAARAFGITPATVKLAAFAVSGFVAGSAGVLWAQAWRNVSTSQFSPALSISLLAVPVIGGLGSLAGAVGGAVVLYVPAFFLNPLAESLFGEFGRQLGFQLALGGLALIAVLRTYPTGLAGAFQGLWERALVWVARHRDSRPMRTSEPPLIAEDIRVSFGGVIALDGVGIRVGEGEIVGLIGPNGAGKTTLLNAVSGIIRPETGSIRIFGEEMADLAPEFRAAFGVARSFQDARLFPGLTVVETIQVALAQASKVGFLAATIGAPWVRDAERQTRRRAVEVLEWLGLSQWAHTLTADLPTGIRRLCDLAAQLAMRPKLLLLDEPTAGVGQQECEEFAPLLRRIRNEMGCSILIVEHNMPVLMSVCDRVYAMEAGRVIAEGTPDDVRAHPAVIASYLGGAPKSGRRRDARLTPIIGGNGSRNGTSRKRRAAVRGMRDGG